jgi:phosphoglycerate dehydrogenase-like enzyme
MGPLTLLVIGDPGAPQMELLKELPPEVKVVVSDDPAQLKAAAPSADVLLNGGFHQELFRKTFPLAVNARWVHNMSTGVEGILTPEVVASPIPLTNGRGVFSEVLAEFVAGAILYFAKDFRRMIRSQEAGRKGRDTRHRRLWPHRACLRPAGCRAGDENSRPAPASRGVA